MTTDSPLASPDERNGVPSPDSCDNPRPSVAFPASANTGGFFPMRWMAAALLLSLGWVLSSTGDELARFRHDVDGNCVGWETSDIGGVRLLIDPAAPGGFSQVIAAVGPGGQARSWLHALGPVAEIDLPGVVGPEVRYLLRDGQGSFRWNEPYGEEGVTTYDAFGVEIPDPIRKRVAVNGLPSIGYRGELSEPGLGTVSLRARRYVPNQGRFPVMDSFEGTPEIPSSLHKYAYAAADPINRLDPSGHETLLSVSLASAIGTSLHSMYDEAVSTVGFALIDTVRGVEAGLTADEIYHDYLVNTAISLGAGLALSKGSAAVRMFRPGRLRMAGESVSRRLYSLLGRGAYWEQAGGISVDLARETAASHGFGLELGRWSRFENARNAVVISRQDLLQGEVNRILLAEEIQHGLDRATSEASRAIQRGLDNTQFHIEVFERIVKNYEAGQFPFLTLEDIRGLKVIIDGLK